jgi:Zn-dependent protease with chaperone function
LQVTKEQQPELFEFIELLCKEIRCPVPEDVCLSHDANAGVLFPASLLGLVIPPRKKLLLGLALINDLNLMEFKALLAHELGHFSQRSLRLSGHVIVVNRLLANMVYVRGPWNQWVIRGSETLGVSLIAVPLFMLVELTRALIEKIFRGLCRSHLSLRHEMEFNADLVAVSVCGSDAAVNLLVKAEFGQACLSQTKHDLTLAAEHQRFTRNLLFHHQRAADYLRTDQRNPKLGRVPDLPEDGTIPPAIFQPEDTSSLPMWDDHPSHYEREINAKRHYLRSPQDDRPAQLLLRNPTALHEAVTSLFYRHSMNLEPDGRLEAPESVQEFIDEEHSVGNHDRQYQGIYDNGWLELEDFDTLLHDASSEPVPDPVVMPFTFYGWHTDEFVSWAGARLYRLDELAFLQTVQTTGTASGADGFKFRGQNYNYDCVNNLLAKVQREIELDRLHLGKVNRQVFVMQYQVAGPLNMRDELLQRYRFHIALQTLLQEFNEDIMQMGAFFEFLSDRKELQWEEVRHVVDAWRQVREKFAITLRQAGEMSPPPLKHWNVGEPLSLHLPSEPSVPDLDPFQSIDLQWAGKLFREMNAVQVKLDRLLIKSMAGVLALQETLAREWGNTAAVNNGDKAPPVEVLQEATAGPAE